MLQLFEMLCIWLEVEADAELYTVTELHNKMTELANSEAVYGTRWLKKKNTKIRRILQKSMVDLM